MDRSNDYEDFEGNDGSVNEINALVVTQAQIVVGRFENTTSRSAGTVLEGDDRNDRPECWTFCGLEANASVAGFRRTSDGVIPWFNNYHVEIPAAIAEG